MHISKITPALSVSLLVAVVIGAMLAALPGASMATQNATPAAASCADVQATPDAEHAGMGHGTTHDATPDAHGGHDMHELPEFDLAYIDMMIPHHQSIIALAEVALPELTDPRLIEMAEEIIATQSSENEEMMRLREMWYGDAEPVSMEMMMTSMPGMGTDMALMDQQMSAEWQVQAFCAAEDKDIAFIEQVIPHHQMAIDTSEGALSAAIHPELVTIAEDVIAAQQAEIDELEAIRADLIGGATPAS